MSYSKLFKFSIFICTAIVCFQFFSCKQSGPAISSLSPRIGLPGETLTIRGEKFGKDRDESYITVGGVALTNSSYIDWQDGQIEIKAPELRESGLVYIFVKGKKSNGILFSNESGLPRPVQSTSPSHSPRVASVTPLSGSIGSIITVTGSNFGTSFERGTVRFSWGGATPVNPISMQIPEFVEASDIEFCYDLWDDREIRVRIPDGAVSGNMEIHTPQGNSRPFYIEVNGKPGTKTYKDKRSYTITYSVNIKVREASGSNNLYLWIPRPVVSASQRNIELISRNVEPFMEEWRGASLYKFDDLTPNADILIEISNKVDVYVLETTVRPHAIRQENSPITNAYIKAETLIPSDDPRIREQANHLAGRERNPYAKAQRIYEWLIGSKMIKQEPAEARIINSPVEAFAAKQLDPYTASLLYCALLRAADVPSIPVAGVLINRNREATRHYWVEFWIDGLGWIPVDPALGAGVVPSGFQSRSDRASYYFGNMDNQRIAFSREQAQIPQMETRGRATSRVRSYALQNIWEEAAGGLESYSSLWGDITITGVYVQ